MMCTGVLKDGLGVQGTLRRTERAAQVWTGPLLRRRHVAALVSTADAPTNITLHAADLWGHARADERATTERWSVLDAWHGTVQVATLPLSRRVGTHDTALLVLTPLP
jgi:hypothetical protein